MKNRAISSEEATPSNIINTIRAKFLMLIDCTGNTSKPQSKPKSSARGGAAKARKQ